MHDRSNIEKGLSLLWGGPRGIAAKIRLRSSLKAVLINQLVNTQAALRSVAIAAEWIFEPQQLSALQSLKPYAKNR
jgi:hypothetical protein